MRALSAAAIQVGPGLAPARSKAMKSAKPITIGGRQGLAGLMGRHAAPTLTGPLSLVRAEIIGILPALLVTFGPVSGEAVSMSHSLGNLEAKADDQELSFQREKRAFLLNLSPLTLAGYSNQFVASCGGKIVDSDSDLSALTTRFFRTHGDVPVYIVRVSDQRVSDQEDDLRVDTPFFEEV